VADHRSTIRAVGRLIAAAPALRVVRYEIAEESMAPALRPGDRVAGIRRPRSVEIGDIVVFELRPGFDVVKRVTEPPQPMDGLWLLGDNPDAGSVDSRTLGPVPAAAVKALLVLRYRPRPPLAV
jgi:hypothetical protein